MRELSETEVRSGDRGAAAQLDFIEGMILEGRRSTEYWGWNFLLWGVAYLVAIAWSNFVPGGVSAWAWPVTMIAAAALTAIIARAKTKGKPVTTRSRAIHSVWVAIGSSIFVFAFPAVAGRHFNDGHAFMAAIEVLLGAAHIASGTILKWKVQLGVGVVWWIAALIANLTQSNNGIVYPFLAATVICNLGFGIYLMYAEARDKARLRAGQVAHA